MSILTATKEPDESWREAVERIASRQRLAVECLEIFDSEKNRGQDDEDAAWTALYEWDCLEVFSPFEETE